MRAGVYALGADGGSSEIFVSNSTFLDISGGAIKLGKSGERGAKAPDPAMPPAEQDRGFVVSDNLMTGIPTEFSSANPVFGAYMADSVIAHNTIHDSRCECSLPSPVQRPVLTPEWPVADSGVCMGWGWGESSYMRNVQIENNSITKPMQLLSDGGGVYTNTPCPDCHGKALRLFDLMGIRTSHLPEGL